MKKLSKNTPKLLLSWQLASKLTVTTIATAAFLGCSGYSPTTDHQGESHQTQLLAASGSGVSHWAKLTVFTSQSSALGITAESSIARYSLVALTPQEDGTFKALETLCDLKTKSKGSSTVTFSKRLIDSIEPNSYTYVFNGDKVSMQGAVEVLGGRLVNKSADPLPTSASLAFDQDGDGNPGISVDVSAKVIFTSIEGQVYVTQRTSWSEKGEKLGLDKYQGQISWVAEQKTLGASNPLLTTVSPQITTLTDKSPFYLVKLPEGSDCKAVKSLQGSELPLL